MNIQKLFEMQSELDAHIYAEHPVQDGEDRLAKKILALQVKLGELANEWRGFKFWSHDQEPRIKSICTFCKGQGFTDHLEDWLDSESHYTKECEFCDGTGYEKDKNPLLEEYVDCLHFILSIGLDLRLTNWKPHFSKLVVHFGGNELITQFDEVFRAASSYKLFREDEKDIWYSVLFSNFLGLGSMLGFTWEQVEQAYLTKTKLITLDKRVVTDGMD